MIQETSLEAYKAVDLPKRETEVYEAIKLLQPCSNQHIAKFLERPINQITGRTNGLYKKGLVIDYDKAKNEFGRNVIRWKLKDNQLNLFK